jgi:glycosyltransferase 2 family protein
MRDRVFTLLKVAISLGLIAYLLLVKVDLAQVGQAIAGANIWYLVLALALYLVAITVGCAKWRLLLAAQGIRLPLPRLFSFTLVGLFFGNFLLPIVAGDVVRGYDLARSTERGAEAAISVLVDKLIGLLAFITAAALMSAYAIWGMGRADLQGLATIVFVAFLGFTLAFASILSHRLRGLFERLLAIRIFQPVAPVYRRLSDAIQAYRNDPGALIQAFGISLIVLLITNVVNWLVAESVGANVPMIYIFLFNPMVAFAPVLIPSIGGLGVNQGAFDLFYATLGKITSSELAVTFSLVMQVIIYASSLPGGVLWLRRRKPARVLADARDNPPVESPGDHGDD